MSDETPKKKQRWKKPTPPEETGLEIARLPKPPRGPGQPKTILSEEELDLIVRLSEVGLSQQQVASVLGVAETVIKDNAADLCRIGKVFADAEVVNTAYQMAISGKYPAVTMFWLKCRLRWKETIGVELTGEDGEDLKIGIISAEPLTSDQWEEQYGNANSVATAIGTTKGALRLPAE